MPAPIVSGVAGRGAYVSGTEGGGVVASRDTASNESWLIAVSALLDRVLSVDLLRLVRGGGVGRRTRAGDVMVPRRQAMFVAGALALLAVIAAIVLTLELRPGASPRVKVMAVVGASGLVGAAVLAGRREGTRGVRPLMLFAAVAWLLGAMRFASEDRVVFTIGILGAWLWAVALGHLALAFPTGRLPGRAERLVIITAYLAATVGQLTWVLLAGASTWAAETCDGCPAPVVSLPKHADLATSVIVVERVLGGVAGIGVVILLARRWRSGSTVQRRSLAPVLAVAGATAVCFSVSVAIIAAGWPIGGALQRPALLGFILLPFAFLAGVWRTRIRRTFGVSRFVEQLGTVPSPDHLAARLATALGDDSLTIVYWLPDSGQYVDRQGHVVALPSPGSGRAITQVDVDGRRVAALVHDASLLDEAGAVRAAGQAAALWLERGRLEAECRAYIAELRESRARLVAASDTERRRIERDLHDGAQQRLAGMLLRMNLERRAGHGDPVGQAALLDEVETALKAALEELRALAAGILPPVLSDRGLAAALEELGARSPVPVTLELSVPDRVPERVEVAAYFVAAEGLANVAKHSNAEHAFIAARRSNTRLIIEIRDDGDGAAAQEGTGLRGLADRVAALDGQLTFESTAGVGTTLRAEIPCAS